MALRDKSQKVGFVYTNIYQIYKNAKHAEPVKADAITSDSRVFRADELADLKITKFQPRTLSPETTGATNVAPSTASPAGINPFDDLKSNINRLQDLHGRLRFMLQELEELVNKK